MAKEALDIIKTAEENAKNIVISAHGESEKIINTAIKENEDKLKKLEDELNNEFSIAKAEAYKKAEEKSRENIKTGNDYANELKENLAKNKEKAINAVIKAVLED